MILQESICLTIAGKVLIILLGRRRLFKGHSKLAMITKQRTTRTGKINRLMKLKPISPDLERTSATTVSNGKLVST